LPRRKRSDGAAMGGRAEAFVGRIGIGIVAQIDLRPVLSISYAVREVLRICGCSLAYRGAPVS
jgi:thiamine monophosphate kinase